MWTTQVPSVARENILIQASSRAEQRECCGDEADEADEGRKVIGNWGVCGRRVDGCHERVRDVLQLAWAMTRSSALQRFSALPHTFFRVLADRQRPSPTIVQSRHSRALHQMQRSSLISDWAR
jgi:hypothetical protein